MKIKKLILIGGTDVGKTSLIERLFDKNCRLAQYSTLSPSFFVCSLNLKNDTVVLEVWDTAGQEQFRSLVHIYIREVDAALIVFDLSNYKSFVEAKIWAHEIMYKHEKLPILVLIGNKKDIFYHREVSQKEASEYAKKIEALYYECSAKIYKDICKMFLDIAKEMLKSDSAKENDEVVLNTTFTIATPECDGFSRIGFEEKNLLR